MLESLLHSVVLDTDDAGLRKITHEEPLVFAKFTTGNCAICKMLEPGFVRLAAAVAYQGIRFVRLSSDENPVAKQLMASREAPFFVSYSQGRLVECDTHATDADVQAQLDRLRAVGSVRG